MLLKQGTVFENRVKDYLISPVLYLYNAGDECTAVTGGYDFYAFWGNTTTSEVIITKESSYIQIVVNGGSTGYFGGIASANVIPTAHNTLNVDFEMSSTGSFPATDTRIGFIPSKTNEVTFDAMWKTAATSISRQTISLDISSIGDTDYLAIINGGNRVATLKIYSVWLE